MKLIIKRLRRFLRSILPKKNFEKYVFIVGAQKAGTTSLHSYLMKHSKIAKSDEKELHFFDQELNFSKGYASYRRMFPVVTTATHALDSSPSYLHRHKVPERIYEFRPDAKIIVILREPVSRAFSAFNMYLQITRKENYKNFLQSANVDSRAFFSPLVDGSAKPDLNYFLDSEFKIINGLAQGEEPALIRRGIYAPQLERYFRIFGRENVLVLFSDELKTNPEKVTNDALHFIGLEPLVGVSFPLKHVREYTADNSDKELIRHYAAEMFENDKQLLLKKYGINVPW